MNLREYLFKKRITPTDFARAINYHPSYLQAITRGERLPGKKLAKIISDATNGEVTIEELLEQEILEKYKCRS